MAGTAGASGGGGGTPPEPFELPRWVLSYDMATLDQTISSHFLRERAVGLDIEWRPTFARGAPQNRTALIQLATPSMCALVPVHHLCTLPPALVELLEARHVWKLGVGIGADAERLRSDFGVQVESVFELAEAAQRLQRDDGVRFPGLPDGAKVGAGLKAIAAACGVPLAKSKKVGLSNWEARPLSAKQQRYAAQDAYAGVWIGGCLAALHARAEAGRVGSSAGHADADGRICAAHASPAAHERPAATASLGMWLTGQAAQGQAGAEASPGASPGKKKKKRRGPRKRRRPEAQSANSDSACRAPAAPVRAALGA